MAVGTQTNRVGDCVLSALRQWQFVMHLKKGGAVFATHKRSRLVTSLAVSCRAQQYLGDYVRIASKDGRYRLDALRHRGRRRKSGGSYFRVVSQRALHSRPQRGFTFNDDVSICRWFAIDDTACVGVQRRAMML